MPKLKIRLHETNELPSSGWQPTVKKVRDLKKGDFFTLKPIEYPKESQVWVMDFYDRHDREYCASKFSDINVGKGFKGDKEVYTGFTF